MGIGYSFWFAPTTTTLSSNAFDLSILTNLLGNCNHENDEIVDMKMRFLDLGKKNVTDEDLHDICLVIEKLGNRVKVIDLGGNKITSTGASHLFKTVKGMTSIEHINLNDNDIDDQCMVDLACMLERNQSIKHLSLNRNRITNSGLKVLTQIVKSNSTLYELDIYKNTGITQESAVSLQDLVKATRIQVLNISNKEFNFDKGLAIPLLRNKIICGSHDIDLSGKGLSDDNVEEICTCIESSEPFLASLVLCGNEITSNGAVKLFNALRSQSNLRELNMGFNDIDDTSMDVLADLLPDLMNLNILGISSNKITDGGIKTLSQSLIGNISIIELDISSLHDVTDESVSILKEIINFSTLQTLYLEMTSISDDNQGLIGKAASMPIDSRNTPIKSNSKSASKSCRY